MVYWGEEMRLKTNQKTNQINKSSTMMTEINSLMKLLKMSLRELDHFLK